MSESDDSDDVAPANILSQFTAVNTKKSRSSRPVIQVVVPLVENQDQYERLPGHLNVDHVLSQVHGKEAYKVRFKSGDIEEISLNRLSKLPSGQDALDDYTSRYLVSSSSSSSASESDNERVRPRSKRLRAKKPPVIIFSDSEDSSRPKRQLRKRKQPSRTSRAETQNDSTRRSKRLISSINQSDTSDTSDTSDFSSEEISVPQAKRRRGRPPLRQSKLKTKKMAPAQIGVRSSQRHRNAVPNMAERLEDDISEVEEGVTGTKYKGNKEKFAKLSKSSEFRSRHQPVCNTCSDYDDKQKGPMVFCQGCTDSYHQSCLGPRMQRAHLVSKVGPEDCVLQCRRCLEMSRKKDPLASQQGHCVQCKEPGPLSKPLRQRLTTREEHLQREENGGTDPSIDVDQSRLNLIDNIMFRCDSCERAWHMSHLPSLNEEGSNDDSELSEQRFQEYSRTWQCKDCVNAPGSIEALIAWRPIDINSYTPGYTSDMVAEDSKEYLIKWRKLSYFKASWMPGSWVSGASQSIMRKAFFKSERGQKPRMTTEDAIPEDYLQVDIVFDVRYSNVVSNRTLAIDMARVHEVDKAYVKYRGLSYEDSVWEEPPDRKDTQRWQCFKAAYGDWALGHHIHMPKSSSLRSRLATVRSKDFGKDLVKQTQPGTLTGGQLMDYQKEGLNWIYFMWFKQQNAVLADEMGLGKTIQVIAFFATLIQDHNCWPFLVVVPNSTCANWRQEIKTWAPSLRVVTYFGSATAKKIGRDYELFPHGGRDPKAHIVVTSYEAMVEDKTKRLFSAIPWAGLVVDEGHRLKNDKNLLYEALTKFSFPFKLLLTGTPLQNNVRELFNILHFCDPSKDAVALEAQYQELNTENVNEVHDMIRPFFLRRTKAQVLDFLPPMAQIIVPISMTVVQKKLYKSILAKNPQLIKTVFKQAEGLKKTERHNLNNILTQLRKCLCHPFVYSKAIEERGVNATLLHRNMVEASAKLQLLELLLPKLQERGHRVLIFSQFLDFLDIIEDFLDGLGLLHLRLDGSMNSLQKQKHIEEFNAPDSSCFAFLLSTRAGGVGINLASADTVIIMDPDFNPHQDIQALSRAHRIGQQNKVLVFQLMTRGSAEEKVMQIGKKKMALDHVLIERMDAEDDAGVDLESILRHGAEALFQDDNTGDIRYDSQSVDKLLDRSEVENTRTGDDKSAESQFSFARVWTNDTAVLEDRLQDSEGSTPNETLWDKILEDRERAAAQEARARAETLGRGKRKRQTVNYKMHGTNKEGPESEGDRDGDFGGDDAASESSQDDTADDSGLDISIKARPFKRASVSKSDNSLSSAMMDGNASNDVGNFCMACDTVHPRGLCRLKLAGVEHCGLCGIAHFGHSRTCPHLNSEMQVAQMLGSLRESTEQRALVEEATKYIRGIRGDLVFRRNKKLKAARDRGDDFYQHQQRAPPPPAIPSQHHQNPYASEHTTMHNGRHPSQHRTQQQLPRQHVQQQTSRNSLPHQRPQNSQQQPSRHSLPHQQRRPQPSKQTPQRSQHQQPQPQYHPSRQQSHHSPSRRPCR